MEPRAPIMTMWNYATQTYDVWRGAPATDAEARQYIPQDGPAQAVYQTHRAGGGSIVDALAAVLMIITQAHSGDA